VAHSRILIAANANRPFLDTSELWRYRGVLYALVRREIKIRYAQTIAGAAWVILQPVLTTAVLTILASHWMGGTTSGIPYPQFAYCGLVPWIYFTHVLNKASYSMLSSGVLTKAYFPRLLLPLASSFGGLVDIAAAASILAVMMAYYRTPPALTVLWLPVSLLLLVLTAFGIGVWLAVLNLFYRDVAHALSFVTQLWFFMTPVAYSVSLVPESRRLLYYLNPMTGVIQCWRWALFGRAEFTPSELMVSLSSAAGILLTGLWYFRRHEPIFADVGEG